MANQKIVYLLLICMALWIFTLPLASEVVINELMYHPPSLNDGGEFLELYNAGNQTADLSHWKFADGIQYTFPQGTLIQPDGYLVISPSPANFVITYGQSNAIGPYGGQLSNDGERIVLADSIGKIIEEIIYHDEQGWPQDADGLGASIERIHPQMPANRFESWKTGPVGGTPSALNSSAIPNPHPIVYSIDQRPVVPNPNEPVTITASIISSAAIASVTLYYKHEISRTFQQSPMFDDAQNGDRQAGDGTYGGVIPAFDQGSVVEFFIQAHDVNGQPGTFPPKSKQKPAIYIVDGNSYSEVENPLYRIVMRTSDNNHLRTRDPFSDVELESSFVFGEEIYYNVGTRFRGRGSRGREPKSYRVNFSNTRYFGAVRKLNLNGWEPDRQFIGLETFTFLRMPVPEKKMVSLLFNMEFFPWYLQVERADQDMLQRLYPDPDGNLYRGEHQANLDYRGEDFAPYRPHYLKSTNELEDDYSDIVQLCYAFSHTSDEEFHQALSEEIDVRQWIRWFAIKQILNDREGGLSLERGDDYYIYHRPDNGLFELIPWDMDSVIVDPIEAVHHHKTPAVQRLLRHPDLARFYYQEILNIMQNELPVELMDTIIERAAPVSSPSRITWLKDAQRRIRNSILDEIPQQLTVNVQVGQNNQMRLMQRGETFHEWSQTEDSVLLYGKSHAGETRYITVNGNEGTYIPWKGTWEYAAGLQSGFNSFEIQALDAGRNIVDSTQIRIAHNFSLEEEEIKIQGDWVITEGDSPLVLDRHLIVPQGTSLHIESGVEIQMASGIGIIVFGAFGVAGQPDKPVKFIPTDEDEPWGALVFRNPNSEAIIEHARFITAKGLDFQQSTYPGAVNVIDTSAAVRHTQFRSYHGIGIEAFQSDLHIEHCAFDTGGEGVHGLACTTTISNCTFENIQGYSDAIDFDLQKDEGPSVVKHTFIRGSEDDGIDLGTTNAILEGNQISFCADKGISVEGQSNVDVINCILQSSNIGVAVKDQCEARLIHNTIYNVSSGIRVYEKNPGQGGGKAWVSNTVVWQSAEPVFVDGLSEIQIEFSHGEGFVSYDSNNNSGPPLFLDAPLGDFHLQEGSPLIDSGVAAEINVDLDGRARPQGQSPDIGAYESQFSTRLRSWRLHDG